MHNHLPVMTHNQRQARAMAKRQLLLQFLASGEVYTNTSVASKIMSASQRSAQRTLSALVLNGSLKVESHMVESRKTFIYGITPHGLAICDKFDKPFFQLGKTNSSYITHHLQTQQARLAAESCGWTDWQPGKILYNQNLPKVPDAIATSPTGVRIALELERTTKSQKNYESVISGHLKSMTKKLWSEVHYLTPPGLSERVQRAFQHVQSVPVNGDRVQLEQIHRDRFKFYELQNWPNERSN